jgi:peptidoglycan/LPS O-acetylase OafA/YrhL
LIASRWSFVYVWQFGLAGTWLLCLPTWLIGCLIAQRQADGTLITAPGSLWIWRPVGILLGSLSLILLYHTRLEIGLPVMMLIFSFYLYFWIQKEISSLKTAKIAFLEWAGTWSYSLYLIHNMVIAKFEEMALPIAPLAVWAAKLASILALSYLFFSLVEFPAHRFARWVGRRPVSP